MSDPNIDGKFDAGDETGNAGIDASLQQFAAANRGNPEVISALERAAAQIKSQPEAFLDGDGAVRGDALAALLGRELAAAGPITMPAANAADVTHYPSLAAMGELDIMAMAFLVMMEAAKSARDDLKAIMAGVKAIDDDKDRWRRVAETLAAMAAGAASAEDVGAARDTIQGKLDSLSELGEMESLRLQMAMDRLTKLMSTLANLLKQASDTASTITGNLK